MNPGLVPSAALVRVFEYYTPAVCSRAALVFRDSFGVAHSYESGEKAFEDSNGEHNRCGNANNDEIHKCLIGVHRI